MTQTKLLIGSLSSDLYRIASLTQRGSYVAADKFLVEAKRWSDNLSGVKLKRYIRKIIDDVQKRDDYNHSLAQAEMYLMYSILLQNYALHLK